jgi:hypothetical protein
MVSERQFWPDECFAGRAIANKSNVQRSMSKVCLNLKSLALSKNQPGPQDFGLWTLEFGLSYSEPVILRNSSSVNAFNVSVCTFP